eukprot:1014541_1
MEEPKTLGEAAMRNSDLAMPLQALATGDSSSSTSDDDEYPDESSLFVGDLARCVTEDQIRSAFSQCGKVENVDIKRDKITGNNLGYGFVQYHTRLQAERAKRELEGTAVGGRRIRIGWA